MVHSLGPVSAPDLVERAQAVRTEALIDAMTAEQVNEILTEIDDLVLYSDEDPFLCRSNDEIVLGKPGPGSPLLQPSEVSYFFKHILKIFPESLPKDLYESLRSLEKGYQDKKPFQAIEEDIHTRLGKAREKTRKEATIQEVRSRGISNLTLPLSERSTNALIVNARTFYGMLNVAKQTFLLSIDETEAETKQVSVDFRVWENPKSEYEYSENRVWRVFNRSEVIEFAKSYQPFSYQDYEIYELALAYFKNTIQFYPQAQNVAQSEENIRIELEGMIKDIKDRGERIYQKQKDAELASLQNGLTRSLLRPITTYFDLLWMDLLKKKIVKEKFTFNQVCMGELFSFYKVSTPDGGLKNLTISHINGLFKRWAVTGHTDKGGKAEKFTLVSNLRDAIIKQWSAPAFSEIAIPIPSEKRAVPSSVVSTNITSASQQSRPNNDDLYEEDSVSASPNVRTQTTSPNNEDLYEEDSAGASPNVGSKDNSHESDDDDIYG